MKSKEINVALKTMSIKARLANLLRKELYDVTENDFEVKYKKKRKLTDQEKIDMFDKILVETKNMHSELNNYKAKRKYKAFIEKEREERKKALIPAE